MTDLCENTLFIKGERDKFISELGSSDSTAVNYFHFNRILPALSLEDRREYWGSKWEVTDLEIIHTSKYSKISFLTAGGTPDYIIYALSIMYPHLTFYLKYLFMGWVDTVGRLYVKNGVRIYEKDYTVFGWRDRMSKYKVSIS